MRNGSRLLIDCLMALGATKCCGVPGESDLAVLDALHDAAGRPDVVLCRDEGGAAFAASAYGKLTHTHRERDYPERPSGTTLARIGAMLDLAVSPEAITPRQILTQMRDAALASQKATA